MHHRGGRRGRDHRSTRPLDPGGRGRRAGRGAGGPASATRRRAGPRRPAPDRARVTTRRVARRRHRHGRVDGARAARGDLARGGGTARPAQRADGPAHRRDAQRARQGHEPRPPARGGARAVVRAALRAAPGDRPHDRRARPGDGDAPPGAVELPDARAVGRADGRRRAPLGWLRRGCQLPPPGLDRQGSSRLHLPPARRPLRAHGREVPARQLPALPRGGGGPGPGHPLQGVPPRRAQPREGAHHPRLHRPGRGDARPRDPVHPERARLRLRPRARPGTARPRPRQPGRAVLARSRCSACCR